MDSAIVWFVLAGAIGALLVVSNVVKWRQGDRTRAVLTYAVLGGLIAVPALVFVVLDLVTRSSGQ